VVVEFLGVIELDEQVEMNMKKVVVLNHVSKEDLRKR